MADEDPRRRQDQRLGSNNPYGAQARQHWAEVEAARQARERQEAMLARFQAVQAQHLARHGPVEEQQPEQQPGETVAPAYQTLPPSGAPQVTDTVRARIDEQQWAQWQRDQSQWAEETLDPNAAAAAAAAAESAEPQYQSYQSPAAGYPSAAPPDYQTYAGPSQGYTGDQQQSQFQGYAGGPTLSPDQAEYFAQQTGYAQQTGQNQSHSGDELHPDEAAALAFPEFHPGFQSAQSPPVAPAPLAPVAPNASNAPWVDASTLNPQQIAEIQSRMGSRSQTSTAPAPQAPSYEGAWSPPVPEREGRYQAYTGVSSHNPLAAQARESSRQAGGGRGGTGQPENSSGQGLHRTPGMRHGQNTGMGSQARGRRRGSSGASR